MTDLQPPTAPAAPGPEAYALVAPRPGDVPPHPVPVQLNAVQVQMPDGQMAVVLRLSTPLGPIAVFLDPAGVVNLGEHLQRLGEAAKSGLLLAGPGGPA
jgi:hypothetical protein